jgi:hemolysin D
MKLTPGMSVQVEVRTGDRRVIEYLLTPLLRYKEEAIRER